MTFLEKSNLEKLKNYNYISTSNSLASIMLTPYWNYVLSFFPLSFAPNLITFIGFLFSFSTGIIFYFDPYFITPAPKVLYFYSALAFFVSQTMDSIDGKQSRRTNSSSPLGQLFDHVLDTFTGFFFLATTLSVFSLGQSTFFVLIFVSFCLTFYLNNLEESLTRRMHFSAVSIVELQLYLIVLFALFSFIWIPPSFVVCNVILCYICVVLYILQSLNVVFTHIRGSECFYTQSKPLIHIVLFNLIWSVIYLSLDTAQYKQNCSILMCAYYMNIPLFVTRIVLFRCTDSAHPLLEFFHLPLVLTMLNVLAVKLGIYYIEIHYNFLFLGVFNIIYFVYFFCSVVKEIAQYLNISVFTLEKRYMVKKS